MVKERSYKILEQLDEYELQEPEDPGMAVYDSDSEQQLTRESRANVVPSALDAEDDGDNEHAEEHSTAGQGVSTQGAGRAADTRTSTEQQQQQQPSAAATEAGASATTVTVPNTTDGVFANMSAKPDLYLGYDDKVPNEPLPTYQDIYGPQSNAAPAYFEPAVISIGDEEELLVEGLPVGSVGVFMVNLIVSTAFQIVGYMLTFLLHSSHAAKNGSLAGLGITFFNFGFYIRTHLGQNIFEDVPGGSPNQGRGSGRDQSGSGDDAPYDMDTPLDNAYFAYLLMIIGAAIFLKAVFDYVRVRRLQTIIESSPEQNV
ncbi:hypothetical protein GQ54DRAFT_200747 [Martensiomyces pterosporus]|nr:hypothetical protein GQ54DRAFT_200747 [Martensiomyces pterosporus]